MIFSKFDSYHKTKKLLTAWLDFSPGNAGII